MLMMAGQKGNTMASLRLAAQDVLDVARDGIGWIALYKQGRSWTSFSFWPDVTKDGTLVFEDYELEQLREIVKIDPNAILVNSWQHNLGDTTCMTRDTLTAALRWQYELGHFLITNHLANIVEDAQTTAPDESQIDADELCNTTNNGTSVAGSLAVLRLSHSHSYSSRARRYVKRRRYRYPAPHRRKKLA